MLKAQADIISAVIIVLIAISLTYTALMWGMPLIQKRQDMAMSERIHNLFVFDLPSRIERIANVGGSETFSIGTQGIWSLDTNNEILTFSFFSKASNLATDIGWIIVQGETCEPSPENPGTFGVYKPYVVCARADTTPSGYNITYKIVFRYLATSDMTKRYKIDLVGNIPTSTGKSIFISRKSSTLSTIDTVTLYTTEIEILL